MSVNTLNAYSNFKVPTKVDKKQTVPEKQNKVKPAVDDDEKNPNLFLSLAAVMGVVALSCGIVHHIAKKDQPEEIIEVVTNKVEEAAGSIRTFLGKDKKVVEGVQLEKGKAFTEKDGIRTMFSGTMETINGAGNKVKLTYENGLITKSEINGELLKTFNRSMAKFFGFSKAQTCEIAKYDNGSIVEKIITQYTKDGKTARVIKNWDDKSKSGIVEYVDKLHRRIKLTYKDGFMAEIRINNIPCMTFKPYKDLPRGKAREIIKHEKNGSVASRKVHILLDDGKESKTVLRRVIRGKEATDYRNDKKCAVTRLDRLGEFSKDILAEDGNTVVKTIKCGGGNAVETTFLLNGQEKVVRRRYDKKIDPMLEADIGYDTQKPYWIDTINVTQTPDGENRTLIQRLRTEGNGILCMRDDEAEVKLFNGDNFAFNYSLGKHAPFAHIEVNTSGKFSGRDFSEKDLPRVVKLLRRAVNAAKKEGMDFDSKKALDAISQLQNQIAA